MLSTRKQAINYQSEENDWKQFEKNNQLIALNTLFAKKKKYILPTFQTITQIVKSKLFFFNDSKRRRIALKH